MVGGTVCEVVESRSDRRAVGDLVLSYSGWQTHAVADARATRRLDPDAAPVSTALGVLGMPGFTAYAGLLLLGKPAPGETVVVAAATGPVGSAVGQIARIKGARAVGIAGGPEKCRALIEEFGFDAAVDHRAPDFRDRLAEAVPDGIDVYFENVGGEVARAVLRHLNLYARIPVCGLVAGYNATAAPEGPDRLDGFMRRVLTKSLTVRGFIQSEFEREHHAQFLEEMSAWVRRRAGPLPRGRHRRPGERRRGVQRHAGRPQLREGRRPGRRLTCLLGRPWRLRIDGLIVLGADGDLRRAGTLHPGARLPARERLGRPAPVAAARRGPGESSTSARGRAVSRRRSAVVGAAWPEA